MKTSYFFLLLLLPINAILAQTIPSDRIVDWTLAGCDESVFDGLDTFNILDYGAIGDGQTNTNQAYDDVIMALADQPGVILFPEGVYRFEAPIFLGSGVTLKGDGATATELQFDLTNEVNAINIKGNRTNDTILVTQNVAKGEQIIFVDDPDFFAIGDWVNIYQNGGGLTYSAWAKQTVGQIAQVEALTATSITVSSPLRKNYETTDAVVVRRIKPVINAGIECLKIKRLDETLNEQTSNVNMDYAQNCRMLHVQSDTCNFAHVKLRYSSNVLIQGCYFKNAFTFGGGGRAYGVVLEHTSGECLIQNNIFKRLRHALLLQAGANGNVLGYNYSIDPFWTGTTLPQNAAGDLVLHGNYPYANLFEGNICQNIVIDNSHDINGPHNTFFRNRAELFGIFMNQDPASDSQNIVGNEVSNQTGFLYGLYALQGVDHFEYGNNVKGTIIPIGSTMLGDESYYLHQKPDFMSAIATWPPIGIPNDLNANSNAAAHRYLNGAALLDCDGQTITSNLEIAVEKQGEVVIYPNPARQEIVLSFGQETEDKLVVSIFDSRGSLCDRRTVSSGNKEAIIDIDNLASGLYIIAMHKEAKLIYTMRFQKL